MAAALVCVILGSVIDRTAVVLGGFAPLLIDIAWTNLSDRRDLGRRLDLLQAAIGVTVSDQLDDPYVLGERTLSGAKDEGGWESLRLYAPTALWSKSESKDRWLAVLAGELGKSIKTVTCVAALPRDAATFERAAVPILERFAHTPGSQICYIPPDLTGNPLAITHFGVAVFENRMLGKYRVILGFAGRGAPHGQYLLTDGFAIDGAAVGRLFTDWFDRWILKRFEGNVLRGEDPVDQDADADLIEQIKKIREAYYPD